MDDSLHAARQGDLILHPPLAAELLGGLVEAVVYAAAVAAVGAAIGGAVVAVVGTGGAATVLTPLIAGAMVSAAAMLPADEDKSIGDYISDFSNWVGNAMFPPEPYGTISSGSSDTYINGKPAARAAGVPGVPDAEPAQVEEPSILDNIGSYAMVAAGMVLPVVGLAQEIHGIFNPPVTTPAAPGSVEAPGDTAKCSKHPPSPEQFVAQGSDKVFINGQPAARVGDKSTCDGPIGMKFSPNVRIGGGSVTVRDIHDGKSAAAKIIGLIAGMLLTRRGGKARPKPRKAPKPKSTIIKCVGRFTQADPIGLLGGVNLHAYAPNSLLWIDPLGLAPKAPLSLPEGYRGRVNRFNTGGGSSFEVHVYAPNGREVGVYGPRGFFNKHGHSASDIKVPESVSRTLNGVAVDELRKMGALPAKGAPGGKQAVREYTRSVKESGHSGCDL